ncbi:efflux RND transporter periplasmic adaptor subunit [Helicobacter sp. Faydin-H64]|uniref:Efflux RND transporter periplasmic adaptor subunit n=2 Tax=Helicobacter turcicus TaxID=2867412 RepID=A0ABS7JLZ1_9HELI|nr:efflux RND transporter periplasmic adaptor subunit [Helicobacter turcicus]MBX7545270.1 efflux RND transporter periplasmic adaptor subunit [Helicobacter turcicus]
MLTLGLKAESQIEIQRDAQEVEQKEVYATFEVQAVQSALLALSANGVVDKVYVDVGSVVKKGDKLLELRAKDLRENTEVARANLEALRTKHSFLSRQFKRYEKSKDALDLNAFEKIKAEYKVSVFELKRAEANYALQKELLDNTILYAPFSGVITQKFVEVGDGVGAISSKAFALESLEKKAIIRFDSRYFGAVQKGDTFVYKVVGVLQDSKLTLHKIYPSIDKNTKKATAESFLKDSKIPSGVFGDGMILLSPKKSNQKSKRVL